MVSRVEPNSRHSRFRTHRCRNLRFGASAPGLVTAESPQYDPNGRFIVMRTWANRITVARILLVIPLILLFFSLADAPARWKRHVLLAIFSVTALTDALDGYLARRLGQITTLGRILD